MGYATDILMKAIIAIGKLERRDRQDYADANPNIRSDYQDWKALMEHSKNQDRAGKTSLAKYLQSMGAKRLGAMFISALEEFDHPRTNKPPHFERSKIERDYHTRDDPKGLGAIFSDPDLKTTNDDIARKRSIDPRNPDLIKLRHMRKERQQLAKTYPYMRGVTLLYQAAEALMSGKMDPEYYKQAMVVAKNLEKDLRQALQQDPEHPHAEAIQQFLTTLEFIYNSKWPTHWTEAGNDPSMHNGPQLDWNDADTHDQRLKDKRAW